MTDETITGEAALGISVFERFGELEAIGPDEVFQNAAAHSADWTADLLATAPTALDYLPVPGGGRNDRAGTGASVIGHDAGLGLYWRGGPRSGTLARRPTGLRPVSTWGSGSSNASGVGTSPTPSR